MTFTYIQIYIMRSNPFFVQYSPQALQLWCVCRRRFTLISKRAHWFFAFLFPPPSLPYNQTLAERVHAPRSDNNSRHVWENITGRPRPFRGRCSRSSANSSWTHVLHLTSKNIDFARNGQRIMDNVLLSHWDVHENKKMLCWNRNGLKNEKINRFINIIYLMVLYKYKLI